MPAEKIRTQKADILVSSGSKSGRAMQLYYIKKQAKKIREEHGEGKLTAEDAARKLRALHSHSMPSFFSRTKTKISA